MALLDLSLVTKTLVEVVKRAIAVSPVTPSGTVNVTSLPPDRLEDLDNALGIYLYHLVEEAAFKNRVWPNRPQPPLRSSPMGLNLYYVISAHSRSTLSEGPYREQLLMGIATKALHDFPIIKDDTEVGGVKVMPGAMTGADNKLHLSLRHVPVNEAVSFWTAGSKALRLCSYYEVSVVLLEPEEPERATGRVLTYGIEPFIGGLPRLEGSRNTIEVTIPGEATPRSFELQPAQVAVDDVFTLQGRALGSGTFELLVRGPGVPQATEVGAAWGASAFGDEITAKVQPTIGLVTTVPGTFAASVRVTRTTTLANGTLHQTAVLSNETPFQIAPRVTVGAPSSAGVFVVTGQTFVHAAITSVSASIGSTPLAEGALGALDRGQFAIKSATEIEMRIPDTAIPGQQLPVRVIVNGSESLPTWVQAP
ncbi:MAG: DUF4255 domain-containing protein [Kofleriaceae bacterium]|nr:DUF4255 domain-containing protein [Kofleriaceae bacterium]